MKKALLVVLGVLLVAAAIGCASVSQLVTPAEIDPQAVAYASKAGVIDPNDFDGYGNLLKALRLDQAVSAAYQVNALQLTQMQEKNKLDHELLKGVVSNNLKIAEAREAALFDEGGLLPLLAGMGGLGGLGLAAGKLFMKRPGDVSQQEVEGLLKEAGVTEAEKVHQFSQLVKGVQTYLELHTQTNGDGAKVEDAEAIALKKALDAAQDDATRLAVKTVKA